MTAQARGYRRVVRALRTAAEPGPEGFTWRGIKFSPPAPDAAADGFYASDWIALGDDERSAEWKVRRTKSAWHARLRIGADRYPGVGATAAEALEAAAAEASNVAAFIVTMLPASSPPAAPKKGVRRASKGVPR